MESPLFDGGLSFYAASSRKALSLKTRRQTHMAARRSIGIVINGVTGRMGYRQHLIRSLLAIREQGGVALPGGGHIWPEPILVGRDPDKLAAIATRHGLTEWTTDLDAALARPDTEIYFDAQVTQQREKAIRQAIAAGKH